MTSVALDAPTVLRDGGATGPEHSAPADTRRLAVRSTVTQIGVKVLHLVLNVVSSLAVVRYLGRDGFGDYSLALTTTMLVGLLADFGLTNVAVREIARDGQHESDVLGTVVVLRAALGLAAIGVAQLVLVAVAAPAAVHAAALLAGVMYFSDAVLMSAAVVFQLRVRQEFEAGVRLVMEVCETSLLFGLIAAGVAMPVLFLAPVVGSVIGAGAVMVLAWNRFGFRPTPRWSCVRPLLVLASAVGPTILLGVASLKIDTLLLKMLGSRAELGWYSAAMQPIEYLFLGTAVVTSIAYPLFAGAYGDGDRPRIAALYRVATEVLGVGTLLIAVAVWFAADDLMRWAYGAEFAAAGGALRLLTVALVLMTQNGWNAFVLLAAGRQVATLRYNVAAVIVSVLLCVALIPSYGIHGTAAAAIGTAVFVSAVSSAMVWRSVGVRVAGARLARIALAVGVGAGAGALVQSAAAAAAWPAAGFVAGTCAALVTLVAFRVVGVVGPTMLAGLGTGGADVMHPGVVEASAHEPVLDLTGVDDAVTPTSLVSRPIPEPKPAELSVAEWARSLPADQLPSMSVILPTFNRCDVVETSLRAFMAQDYPADRFEVLVADNSTDGTPAMVQRLAAEASMPIRLISSDERLPAVKRNQALRAASGDYVVWMNDDVWVRPDFLRQHAAMHLHHTDPVAVLGLVEQSPKMPDLPFIRWYRPFAYDAILGRDGHAVDYRYHWSMNLSHSRSVMLDRNLIFHEDWANIGHEDVELGYRWTRAGYDVVFHAAAWGEHYHPHDLDSACRLQASIGRGLRDLEVLILDADLLERYGVTHPGASEAARRRMAIRGLLFNRWTVPVLQRWFAEPAHHGALAEWCFWKIMLHHAQVAYDTAPRRFPSPTITLPATVVAEPDPAQVAP